jgi:hypothetical protein
MLVNDIEDRTLLKEVTRDIAYHMARIYKRYGLTSFIEDHGFYCDILVCNDLDCDPKIEIRDMPKPESGIKEE